MLWTLTFLVSAAYGIFGSERWLNIQRAAEQRKLDDRGESVTVRIPFANELTQTAVEEFRVDRDAQLRQLRQSISKGPTHGESDDE